MEDRVRSRAGYIDNNFVCPMCRHEHDENEIIRMFVRSGNKFTMSCVCDGCCKRVVVQRHTLGYYSLYEYVDYKKRRMIKNGWVQQRFYNGKQI